MCAGCSAAPTNEVRRYIMAPCTPKNTHTALELSHFRKRRHTTQVNLDEPDCFFKPSIRFPPYYYYYNAGMSQPMMLYFQNGNIYTGSVYYDSLTRSYLPHGNGTMTTPSGDTYTGSFSQGYKHGQGVSSSPTRQRTYRGGFVSDREEGYATIICPTELGGQRTFVGYMQNNVRHGRGQQTETTNTGRTVVFDGTWSNDVLSGPGMFTLTEAGVTHFYQGSFTNGKLEGYGTYSTSQDGTRYNAIYQGGNMICRY